MDLSFANPAGFWALLALPVVLGIHFLQRQSRRVVTSTLFLFEALNPVSAQGRRVETAAQLPAALAATRRRRPARMAAWRDRAGCGAIRASAWWWCSTVRCRCWRSTTNSAARCRRGCVRSPAPPPGRNGGSSKPTRRGPRCTPATELPGLLAALDHWTPHLGTHDFRPGAQRRPRPRARSGRRPVRHGSPDGRARGRRNPRRRASPGQLRVGRRHRGRRPLACARAKPFRDDANACLAPGGGRTRPARKPR